MTPIYLDYNATTPIDSQVAEAMLPYIHGLYGNPSSGHAFGLEARAGVDRARHQVASMLGCHDDEVLFTSGGTESDNHAIKGIAGADRARGNHVITSNIEHPAVEEVCRYLEIQGLEVTYLPVDGHGLIDPQQVEDAITDRTIMVTIMHANNEVGTIQPIREIADIAHRAGAELAVDSTFASPIATRPLTLGADYVIHSLTKYIGGHGDAMGGAVLGTTKAMEPVESEGLIHLGGTISPFNAWLIQRGLATLPIRMEAHEKNAVAVASYLEQHPAVDAVLYPGLPSHPQYELARTQMENYSGMVSVRVRNGETVAVKMAKELKVFHYAVSLGHHRSLVYWIGTDDLVTSSYQIEGSQLAAYREMAGEGVFRMSIGLEDPEDLCADLDQVLR